MSTTPPIQYSGPSISVDVPWNIRVHLQAMYQKLGNHTQAFGLIQQTVSKLKSGSTTTNIINEGGGSIPSPTPTTAGIAINDQVGVTSYSTQNGDNGTFIVLDDASGVAVTLNAQTPPWGCFIGNLGSSGTVTLTPASGTITYAGTSGGSSMPLSPGEWAVVVFDGTNWWGGATAGPGSGGTITGVTAGTGLTGGGSSGTVTLNIGNTAVTPGSYTNTNVTVNAQGQITAAANGSGGGGGYLKGNITVTPSGPGTYQGSGTITGATVGSAVLVGVTNSTEAAEVSNLLGWVTSTNNVTIQATFSSGVLGLFLPVVVFI